MGPDCRQFCTEVEFPTLSWSFGCETCSDDHTPPQNSGLLYHNDKGTLFTVLLALVDANMKLTALDVGAFGRSSDGSIFSNSNFPKMHFYSDQLI